MSKTRAIIQLEDYQFEYLRKEAFSQKISMSKLIRRIIENDMKGKEGNSGRIRDIDRAMSFVGKKGCGKTDVARRHDDYLAGLSS